MEVYSSKDWHDTMVRLDENSDRDPADNKNAAGLTLMERYSLTNLEQAILGSYSWSTIPLEENIDITDPLHPDDPRAGWVKLLQPVRRVDPAVMLNRVDDRLAKPVKTLSTQEIREFVDRFVTPYEFAPEELEHAKAAKNLFLVSSMETVPGLPFILEKLAKESVVPQLIITRALGSCSPMKLKAHGLFALCEYAQASDAIVEHDEDNPLIASELIKNFHGRYALTVNVPYTPAVAWGVLRMEVPQDPTCRGYIRYIDQLERYRRADYSLIK